MQEAVKDPPVVRVPTSSITSSPMGEIRALQEALERKEEKIAELQDRVETFISRETFKDEN